LIKVPDAINTDTLPALITEEDRLAFIERRIAMMNRYYPTNLQEIARLEAARADVASRV
jgi:hypothetical protein